MQRRLCERFAGLTPKNFAAGLRVACTAPLRSPPGFESAWSLVDNTAAFEEQPWLTPHQLNHTTGILLTSDVSVSEELEVARRFLGWAGAIAEMPPIIFAPLEAGEGWDGYASAAREAALDLVEAGVDGVITGEPSGFELALAMNATLSRARLKAEAANAELGQRMYRASQRQSLEEAVDNVLWRYAPHRLRLAIPRLDHLVEADGPDGLTIAGYRVGRKLRGWAGATVVEAQPPAGVVPAFEGGEAMQVIQKSAIRDVPELMRFSRMWQIMRTLSTDWQHPNIAAVRAIYHAPSCLYLRIERLEGNLYQRLKARDSGDRPLRAVQLRSVVTQITAAVEHMHGGPFVCHRDIKPENVLIAGEREEELAVKITEFGFALQSRESRCRSPCGTFPFVAPEVMVPGYSGFMADMWSMGVLLLEVACGIRTVEGMLEEGGWEPSLPKSDTAPTEAMERFTVAIKKEGCIRDIITAGRVAELSAVADWYAPIVSNLIRVVPKERLTARQLSESLAAWPPGEPEAEEAERQVEKELATPPGCISDGPAQLPAVV